MTIDIVTIFPATVEAGLREGVVARARQRGLVDIRAHDLREHTTDRHRTVDDQPFGGGPGMVLKPEPVCKAVEAIRATRGPAGTVVLTSPAGRTFRQDDAERLAAGGALVLVCGRYEGIDDRVRDELGAEELSIGDYVLTGGELPALVIADAICRLVPGVVGDEGSVAAESFAGGLLDYPHYTRPAVFRGRPVPEVLLSGHHEAVAVWRRQEALRRTFERRPDLLARAALTDAEMRAIDGWRGGRNGPDVPEERT